MLKRCFRVARDVEERISCLLLFYLHFTYLVLLFTFMYILLLFIIYFLYLARLCVIITIVTGIVVTVADNSVFHTPFLNLYSLYH